MKERAFNAKAHEVRAILEGRQTQFRRVVKPQPRSVDGGVPFGDAPAWAHAEPGSMMMRCPYGKRGDRLWVRESLGYNCEYGHYYAADRKLLCSVFDDEEKQTGYSYECAMREASVPSIHLPRRWARITLEIVSVRVERLQDISDADALAEGIHKSRMNNWFTIGGLDGSGTTARAAFALLWNKINAANRPKLPSNTASKRYARVKAWLEDHPDTTSWTSNPWVWVVEFRRVEGGSA